MRLARYLREFVGLRSTTIYDLNKYESVQWFGDMPQESACQSPAWNDEFAPGDPWLVVHKQQLPKPPIPPEAILPWIDQQALKIATAEMPTLRPTRLEPDLGARVADGEEPPLVERKLEDHPEVVSAYERFRPIWLSWSEDYQRRKRIQNVYAELFRLHTQVQKQGEIVELVLGLGLLAWRGPSKGKSSSILRHIVTARVDLHFDPATGIIELDGATDGGQVRIEDDMLDAELRPERGHYASVNDQLSAIGDDVWDRARMSAALKSWVGALHPDSEWSPNLKPGLGGADKPMLTFAPALILRKRSQIGMVRIYDALIRRMSHGDEEIPPGWESLIDDRDDHDVEVPSSPGHATTQPAYPKEIYFPLPANREQRRIVDAITQRRGVLVQGPPGTGKSHTIANLVCHLLATRKRVLITAETGRALKVLKEKLPKNIQPLCVSLLGQGGDAFAELNSAVQGITTRHASWSPGGDDERISEIDRDLDATRRALAKIDTELRSLRQEETYPHSLMDGAYAGTASVIAHQVAMERQRFDWLRVPREALDHPPATKVDMLNWLRIRRTCNEDMATASSLRVVGTDKLPTPADFGIAVTIEREAKEAIDRLASLQAHPAYQSIVALNFAERAGLGEALRKIIDRRKRLFRLGYEWLPAAITGALEGRQARWQALFDQSWELVSLVERLLDSLGSYSVLIPPERDAQAVRADAAAVIEHLKLGGKWSNFGLLTPRAVKERIYLRQQVTVDGQPADTVDRLLTLCQHLDLTFAIKEIDLAWSDLGGLPAAPQPRIRLAAIKEHVGNLKSALDYALACQKLGQYLSKIAPSSAEPNWLSSDTEGLLEIVEASEVEERHRLATEQTTVCLRELKAARNLHDTHPVITSLIRAVDQREVTAYSQAHEQVGQIEQTRRDQEFRRHVEFNA